MLQWMSSWLKEVYTVSRTSNHEMAQMVAESALLILINIVFSSLTKLWDAVHELFNIAQTQNSLTKKIDWAYISHVIV